MPNSYKSRSRSRNHASRTRSHDSRSGNRSRSRNTRSKDRCSRSRNRDSRSRGHNSRSTRRSLPMNVLTDTMDEILARLSSLEQRRRSPSLRRREPSPMTPPLPRAAESAAEHRETAAERPGSARDRRGPATPSSPGRSVSAAASGDMSATERIVDAIRLINTSAQSTGKLDSGMRGPYRVVKALPHGRYELELLAGSYGKSTQAAAEFMVPWRGEWTPDACTAFFESADPDDAESTPEPAAGAHAPAAEPEPGASSRSAPGQSGEEELEDVLPAGRPC